MNQKKVQKKKMLLVLPVLVIPFLTFGFWALGGGKGNASPQLGATNGLNVELPGANLKEEKLMDKLGFYDKAAKDSMKLAEWMRSDPYYQKSSTMDSTSFEMEQLTKKTASKFNQRLNTSPYERSGNDPEQMIMQKIALLEKEMNKPASTSYDTQNEYPVNSNNEFAGEVDRLEKMMQVMDKTDIEDREMQQLEGTLDKILDIQHPQRIRDKIKEKSLHNKEQVFVVSKQSGTDTVVKGFFGLDNEQESPDQNAIEAVVHENQTLVNGAVIKLRLLNDIYINGERIPKDNFVFGIASLNDERLIIEINSIRYANSLYPVKLQVYDLDGLSGIYVPGAITRDVAKQSADNSLQLMELSAMDPSLKAQATAAGIGAAKNLLRKKVKLVKVMVKAGYKILLKDKNNQL